MDADELLFRHRKHTEGVGIAQVVLGRIGDILYVGKRLDFVRRDAGLCQALVVKGDVAVAVIDQRLEPFKLQGLHIGAGHAFHFGVPDIAFHVVYQPFLSGAAAG